MIDFEKIIKKGKHIDCDVFSALWDDLEGDSVKIRKLEFLQTYAFMGEEKNYQKGKYKLFLKYLQKFHDGAFGGKANMSRIHYVEYPLDPYLEMEYYTYLINEKYGQDIRVTNRRELFPEKMYDFLLFNNGNLLIHDFGKDSWNGAWWVTDKQDIKELTKWYDKVFEESINFKTMMFPKKEIIDGMKSLGIIE